MHKLFFLFPLLFFFACSKNNELHNNFSSVLTSQQTINVIAKDSCDFFHLLNDPNIPENAKKLVFDHAPYSEESLDYFDSLEFLDKNRNAFYFKAVTNSYKIADGAYAEGLGFLGKEYVEKHTIDFLSYFDNTSCFTESDLKTWVNIVMLEFSLIAENEYNNTLLEDYIKTLNEHSTKGSIQQKNTLNKFNSLLKDHWKEILKHKN
jgi:hypothetical protein